MFFARAPRRMYIRCLKEPINTVERHNERISTATCPHSVFAKNRCRSDEWREFLLLGPQHDPRIGVVETRRRAFECLLLARLLVFSKWRRPVTNFAGEEKTKAARTMRMFQVGYQASHSDDDG